MRDLTVNEIEVISAGELSCPQPPPSPPPAPTGGRTMDKMQQAPLDFIK